jgi:glycosidase
MKSRLFSCLALFLLCQAAFSQKANTDAWRTPDWAKSATIYEVNVRQYTKDGTFKAFEKEMPRLRKMGVEILWIMPIFPIGEKGRKGSLGSYYAVKDYRAVNPEFGTLADLQHLVKSAHAQGFKVILDWVANHSAPDNDLVNTHPEWYTHDSLGHIIPPVPDWSDVADFNYDQKGLRNYQIESMKYWIKNADVDGFRCDVAMMVPLDFWRECRIELDKTKKVFMLAEGEGPEFHRNGFDMTYGWDYLNICNKIAKGEKTTADLYDYFDTTARKYKPWDNIMYFTTNHDENSWNGTEYERLGKAAKAFAVLSAIVPGIPLVYTGQESALDHRLAFFEKDSIAWGNYPLQDFYSKLLHLKETNPVLWIDNTSEESELSSDKKAESNFVFVRRKGGKKVLTIINLSDKATDLTLNTEATEGVYTDLFTGKPQKITRGETLHMEPWGYHVFVQ